MKDEELKQLIEKYINKYGEENRRLFESAITWLVREGEPKWGFEINRNDFVKNLLEGKAK